MQVNTERLPLPSCSQTQCVAQLILTLAILPYNPSGCSPPSLAGKLELSVQAAAPDSNKAHF